jgi:hypothetical protein
MEENLGEEINHRFKAMENIVILSARQAKYDKLRSYHSKMLGLMSKVARNDVSDAINNILDAVQRHLQNSIDEQKHIYSKTLNVLKTSNPQLWFTICLRLGKILLDQGNIPELETIIVDLKASCRKQTRDNDGD